MGGRGSGRWERFDRKKTVDDFKTIDIRQWAKNGGLENQKFKAGWKSDGKITGSIDVQTSRCISGHPLTNTCGLTKQKKPS